MKRYLYLLAIVLVIAVVVLVGILIARRTNPGVEPIDTGGGSSTPGGLPVAPPANNGGNGGSNPTDGGTAGTTPNYEGQKFSVVAENKALDFFVHKDMSVVFIQPDGQIMKVRGGQVSSLSSSLILNLITAQFSYDGKNILAVFGDRLNPETSVFDVTSKAWRPLAAHMQSPSWSPTNHQIAYLGERNGSGAVFTLDASLANGTPQEIIKISAQDIQLRWTSQNQILLSDRGSALTRGSVWSLSTKNKTLTPVLIDNPGLDLIWGIDYGLVFTANQNLRGRILNLFDAPGAPLHEMSFLTLPSKCVFDTETVTTLVRGSVSTSANRTPSRATSTTAVVKTLYCAVPKNVEVLRDAALPDSYFRKELFTEDEFYRVNLTDGKIDVVPLENAVSIDAVHLKVFNNTLFFINRLDQKLYSVSLR